MNIPVTPLSWPKSKPKSMGHEKNPFKVTVAAARDDLIEQIGKVKGMDRFVISSNAVLRMDGYPAANQPKNAAPGVAVWFSLIGFPFWFCVAIDKYDSIAANMRQIALAIKALREFHDRIGTKIERSLLGEFYIVNEPVKEEPKQEYRSGGHTQSQQQAPPPPPPPRQPESFGPDHWRTILQLTKAVSIDHAKMAYRRLAQLYHSDKPTGSKEQFQRLNNAYEDAKEALGFK